MISPNALTWRMGFGLSFGVRGIPMLRTCATVNKSNGPNSGKSCILPRRGAAVDETRKMTEGYTDPAIVHMVDRGEVR